MSTRGIYGFRKNGMDKLQYNDCDSYPRGLGNSVVSFLEQTSIEELNAIFDRIILIDDDTSPTPEQIEECKKWTCEKNRENMIISDWSYILLKAEGELSAYKDGLNYMIESNYFITDSLFCEYGYIINLDNNTLEFWRGFQKEPQEGNRYGVKTCDFEKTFYPCKLALSFPLNEIPKDVIKIMDNY